MAYIYQYDPGTPADDNNAIVVGYRSSSGFTQRIAQSLTANINDVIVGLGFMMRNPNGAGGVELTFSIQTNNGSIPSGTLANANLTGAQTAFNGTGWVWQDLVFATPGTLAAGGSIWAVCKVTTEPVGSGTSYYTNVPASDPFAGGNNAIYGDPTDGAWAAYVLTDTQFRVDGTLAVVGGLNLTSKMW